MKTTCFSFTKGMVMVCACIMMSCENKKVEKQNTTSIKSKKQIKSVVSPLFKNIDISYEKFIIEPNKKIVLTTSRGSKIYINESSLLDSIGNSIREKVELNYREFMDHASIITSGIPMTFKDTAANLEKHFQSAGMFELLAKTQSGKLVKINNLNPIKVDLATNVKDDGYSNFYLNSTTGNWIYSGEERKEINPIKTSLNKQLKKLKEITAFLGKDFFVLNGMNLLDAYFNDNYEKIASFYGNTQKSMPKKLLKYGIKSQEIRSYSLVKLNQLEIPAELVIWENMSKEEFPGWTKNKQAEIKNIEGDIYECIISDAKKKSAYFKARIRAVMTIKSMFKFDSELWSKNFEEILAEIKKQEQALASMNDVFRILEVNKFGIYNCDRFISYPDWFTVKAHFTFPVSQSNFKPEKVIYVSRKNKLTVQYKLDDYINMTFYPDSTASIYTVLEDNMLAEVNTIDLLKYNKKQHMNCNIVLNFKVKTKINSIDEIKNSIGI